LDVPALPGWWDIDGDALNRRVRDPCAYAY